MDRKYSYRDVAEELSGPNKDFPRLSKQTVLNRMIEELTEKRQANIEILDWPEGDDSLPVEYATYDSLFGELLIANTPMGVCYLGLLNANIENVTDHFRNRFGYANPQKTETPLQKMALDHLHGMDGVRLPLQPKGTPYQIFIWKKLLLIPFGNVVTYSTLADSNKHSRAAGAANARNPIFYLLPCHRIVRADGSYDEYAWGKDLKTKLLTREFEISAPIQSRITP